MNLPTHALVQFVFTKSSQQNAIATVRKDVDDDTADMLKNFFDDNFKRIGKTESWMVKSSEAHEICAEIDRQLEEMEKEEDESDDELIQEALKRRFKSESSGKHIEEETLDDSEDEDVVSLSRRLRHIYKVVGKLQAQLDHLNK